MGFSSALQGASSHDAILSRVDAELRLLENMKRCLTARVKADREYAIALNSFVLQVCYLYLFIYTNIYIFLNLPLFYLKYDFPQIK